MTMFSSIGSSRNVRLTPSGRDEWSAGLAIASSLYDAAVVRTHNNSQKFRRYPHTLRLDDNRVVYSFCDLHSIPEDEPVSEYRQVLRDERLERVGEHSEMGDTDNALSSKNYYAALFLALQNARLEREGKQNVVEGGDTTEALRFHQFYENSVVERLERKSKRRYRVRSCATTARSTKKRRTM